MIVNADSKTVPIVLENIKELCDFCNLKEVAYTKMESCSCEEKIVEKVVSTK